MSKQCSFSPLKLIKTNPELTSSSSCRITANLMLMTDCGGDYDCMCKEWWGVEVVFWSGWWWMVFELVFEVYQMVTL